MHPIAHKLAQMDELQELRGRPLTLHVGIGVTERRLDKYLHGRFRNLSRHFLQDAIRSGGVKVNGKPVKPSFRLTHGDVIEMVIPEPPSKDIEPENIPLDVLYEDDDVIILNKQPDLIVHPCRGNIRGTLVNALVHYSDRLSSGLGEFRPGIVHRLDRDTSGVMVVTKHEGAQWKIAKQFEQREVDKTYLAIVHGTPELRADRINAPLGVHPTIREKYAIRPEIGKEAVTFYEVVEAFRGFSLLKLDAAHRSDAPDPRAPVLHQAPDRRRRHVRRQAGLSLAIGRRRAGHRRAGHQPGRPARPDPRIHPPHDRRARQIRSPLPRRHAAPPRHAPQVRKQ